MIMMFGGLGWGEAPFWIPRCRFGGQGTAKPALPLRLPPTGAFKPHHARLQHKQPEPHVPRLLVVQGNGYIERVMVIYDGLRE